MLPSTPPQTRVQAVRQTFPGRPEQVGAVRRLVRTHLAGHPCGDDAAVVASELATNAVIHTASGGPGGRFVVTITGGDAVSVHIEVRDEGGPVAFQAVPGQREGGRGLTIVAWLTSHWDVTGDASGRTVHAVLRPNP